VLRQRLGCGVSTWGVLAIAIAIATATAAAIVTTGS
jgi:hypothetical protein